MAAHAGGGNVGIAASFLLMHAPAFLALGLLLAPPATRIGGWVLVPGVVIFAGDLLARDYLGGRLFPMAAPAGGILMIGGWLIVAASSAIRGRES